MPKFSFFTILFLFLSFLGFAKDIIWKAQVTTGEYGLLNVNFFVQENNGFLWANSAPGASKRIIGGLKSSLAKGYFERNGSIIALDSLALKDGNITGFLRMNKLKYAVKGTYLKDKINLLIYGIASGLTYGTLLAEEVSAVSPANNYPAIWEQIKTLTEKKIYRKQVLESKQWKTFTKEMEQFAKIAQDDAEFVYGFYLKSMELPFSHFIAMGSKAQAGQFVIPELKASVNDIKPTLNLINKEVAVLDIPKFNFRAAEIDILMEKLLQTNPGNLVIDLRENSGGDMEGAMRLCQYLIKKTTYGGAMLTQHYWNTHAKAPSESAYAGFKQMNEANYAWFKNQVKTVGGLEGLVLKTEPVSKTYPGKVYILTSKTTASACEPFVYSMKTENIAKVVGEKTAGAVLSMEMFPISNLTVTIPMLDFYTADGNRLDGVGVEPTIKTPKKEALQVVLNTIGK